MNQDFTVKKKKYLSEKKIRAEGLTRKKNSCTSSERKKKNRASWKFPTPPPPITFLMVRPLSRKHRVPVRRPFLLVLGQCTALYWLLSSCFKMTSDREKWSNYVHSYMSITQGVNTQRFCAGTQALVPGCKCGQPPSIRWQYLTRTLKLITFLFYHQIISFMSALKNSKYSF